MLAFVEDILSYSSEEITYIIYIYIYIYMHIHLTVSCQKYIFLINAEVRKRGIIG
jgi:hypothetical protein